MTLWTPAQLGAGVIEYDARVGVTNVSGKASQWDDNIGSVDAVQATAGLRPTIGTNVITFPSGSFQMTAVMPYPNYPQEGCYAVCRLGSYSGGNGGMLLASTSGGRILYLTGASTNQLTLAVDRTGFVAGPRQTVTVPDTSKPYIVGFSTAGWPAHELSFNGNTYNLSAGDVGYNTWDTLIGGGGYNNTADIHIHHIVRTPTKLNATNRQLLEGYFAHSWDATLGGTGLRDGLVAGHPYKNEAPSVGGGSSGLVQVKVGGLWKPATPHIKIAGAWKPVTPSIKVGGAWKAIGGSSSAWNPEVLYPTSNWDASVAGSFSGTEDVSVAWADQRGAYNATQLGAASPKAQDNGILFGNGEYMLANLPANSQTEGLYAVVKLTVDTTATIAGSQGNGGRQFRFTSKTGLGLVRQGVAAINGTTVPDSLNKVVLVGLGIDWLSSPFEFYHSGVAYPLVFTTAIPGASITAIGGGFSNGTGETMRGYIYQLIRFPQKLIQANREKLEGHLCHKWDAILGVTDLVGALASGHPYKSAPP